LRIRLPGAGPGQDRFRVFHEDQPPIEERDLEDTMHGVAPAHEHKPSAGLARAGVRREQRTQAARIHEADGAEVEEEELGTGALDRGQRALEHTAARDVELTVELEQRRAAHLLRLDLEPGH
jgi:hypothetical protein